VVEVGGMVLDGELQGLQSSCGGDHISGGDQGCHILCRVGCLQWTAAAGVAW
jgi:hypothetical protein